MVKLQSIVREVSEKIDRLSGGVRKPRDKTTSNTAPGSSAGYP